jgi:hypothetical protein
VLAGGWFGPGRGRWRWCLCVPPGPRVIIPLRSAELTIPTGEDYQPGAQAELDPEDVTGWFETGHWCLFALILANVVDASAKLPRDWGSRSSGQICTEMWLSLSSGLAPQSLEEFRRRRRCGDVSVPQATASYWAWRRSPGPVSTYKEVIIHE